MFAFFSRYRNSTTGDVLDARAGNYSHKVWEEERCCNVKQLHFSRSLNLYKLFYT